MPMIMSRRFGTTASFSYHAAKAKGRSGGGSIYDNPVHGALVLLYCIPGLFVVGVVFIAAVVAGGPIAALTVAAAALAITALIKGW